MYAVLPVPMEIRPEKSFSLGTSLPSQEFPNSLTSQAVLDQDKGIL